MHLHYQCILFSFLFVTSQVSIQLEQQQQISLIKPHNHATYHYWNQPSSKTPWYSSVKLINKKTLNQKDNIIKNFDKLE